MAKKSSGAADKEWGYLFGVDGLMTPNEACEHLSVSIFQLNKLTAQQLVRKGIMPSGKLRLCKRSVNEFAQSLEL